MKKMLCVLLLAGLSGCYYQGYAVRRVAPAEPPLSREEVERLANAGVSEPVVVEMIEKRGATPLSADDLVGLKKAGVSDSLVQKMIASERKQTAQVVMDDYYYAYPSSYYYYGGYPYSPYYYPYYGVGVGVGFSYGYGWGWGSHSHWRGSGGVRIYR
jgi:hypothetical protein